MIYLKMILKAIHFGKTINDYIQYIYSDQSESISNSIDALAYCCRICYIENTKRETASGYPGIIVNYLYSRQLFAVVGGYLRFPLKIS